MRILYLGPDSPLRQWLADRCDVDRTEDRITDADCDLIVSYGYRHILRDLSVPAVNLHISALPWNRGADPNLWSWVDKTPKGVSIHWIDDGIDTGPLVAQRIVTLEPTTLRLTYAALQQEIQDLFRDCWPIKSQGAKQAPGGSYHRAKDKDRMVLPMGWDTPVSMLSQ